MIVTYDTLMMGDLSHRRPFLGGSGEPGFSDRNWHVCLLSVTQSGRPGTKKAISLSLFFSFLCGKVFFLAHQLALALCHETNNPDHQTAARVWRCGRKSCTSCLASCQTRSKSQTCNVLETWVSERETQTLALDMSSVFPWLGWVAPSLFRKVSEWTAGRPLLPH